MAASIIRRSAGLLALALVAGAPAPVPAQPQAEVPGSRTPLREDNDFRSCHWLSDRPVVNERGETIATASDLLVERGSGRTGYIMIKTGTVLGLGGRSIAVPYGAFRWNPSNEKLVLSATKEQLETMPEVTAEEMKALKDLRSDRRSPFDDRLASGVDDSRDIYVDRLDREKKTRIEGEITAVERVNADSPTEQVVVTVTSADGSKRKAILGPSWFVNTGALTPMRGDRVVIEAFTLPRDDAALAMKMRSGSREIVLRDASGAPAWAVRTIQTDGRTADSTFRRFVPVSTLRGMKIDCHGNECGKVADVVVERVSGQAAFISIDPNQNFLGIGDTKRLVPWTVSSLGADGTLRIDASKEMVLNSPETPSDLGMLNGGSQAEMAYRAYGVPEPRFTPARPTALSTPASDAWSEKGAIIASINRDASRQISGIVITSADEHFRSGIPAARVLRIKTAAGEELVVLGPAWYPGHQSLGYGAGDRVLVDVDQVTIDGKPYWLVRTFEANGKRTMYWDNGRPAWARP